MQCMAGASLAVGSASGIRAWLATRGWAWLTPKVMRRATVGLMGAAVVASSVLVSSAAPPAQTSPASGAEQQRTVNTPSGLLQSETVGRDER